MNLKVHDVEHRVVSGSPELIRCSSSRSPDLARMETSQGLDPSDPPASHVVDAVCPGPDSKWAIVHMGCRRVWTIADRAHSDALVGRIQSRAMV